jgi:hypothetical protein
MRKIFYNPDTLQIMGMSEGEDSMSFPYVITEEDLHALNKCSIELNEGVPQLIIDQSPLE